MIDSFTVKSAKGWSSFKGFDVPNRLLTTVKKTQSGWVSCPLNSYQVAQTVERAPVSGWNYRTSVWRTGRGWCSVGPEVHGFMDDFGSLVLDGNWQV